MLQSLITPYIYFSSIIEEGHKSNTSICRQHGQKEQHVYTSNGRNVVIELSKRSGTAEFLIHYKGIITCSFY